MLTYFNHCLSSERSDTHPFYNLRVNRVELVINRLSENVQLVRDMRTFLAHYVEELGEVARIANPMSSIMRGDLMGIFISAGQGAAVATGIMQGNLLKTTLGLVPYGFARLATNPTGIKLLTNTIKAANAGRGYLSSDLTQTLGRYAARGATSTVIPALNPYRTDMPITTPGIAQE